MHYALLTIIGISLLAGALAQAHAEGWGPLPSSYPDKKTMAMLFEYRPAGFSPNGTEGLIHLKLFDARTGLPVQYASLWMTVMRGDSRVMHSGFYTYSGNLTLNLQHGSDYQWTVAPDHDPIFVGGFESKSDTINVDVQPLANDVPYHFEVEPAVFDEPKMIFFKPSGIKFDVDINSTMAYNKTVASNMFEIQPSEQPGPMNVTGLPEKYIPPVIIKPRPNYTATVEIPAGTLPAECKERHCLRPDAMTVRVGTQVTWYNHDIYDHTVTSGRPNDTSVGTYFDSGAIAPGGSFNYTFSEPGNFSYLDEVRPWITGNVLVIGQSAPAGTPDCGDRVRNESDMIIKSIEKQRAIQLATSDPDFRGLVGNSRYIVGEPSVGSSGTDRDCNMVDPNIQIQFNILDKNPNLGDCPYVIAIEDPNASRVLAVDLGSCSALSAPHQDPIESSQTFVVIAITGAVGGTAAGLSAFVMMKKR